jgi:hypothetical protein
MTSLSELPDELQYSIAHAVDERTAVVNLSLACRALRPACLRVLFETFTLHLGTFEPSSPGPLLDISKKDLDHLRSHVRCVGAACTRGCLALTARRTLLLLDDPSTDAREDISRLLFKILPRFTGLHTVIASGLTSSGLWQSLFSLLCTAPHLTHLSLRSSPWIACPVVSAPLPTAFHSLTVGHGRAPPPEQQPHLLAETRTLNTFMLYHGAALRELTLPAELGMWAFLAGQRWPALTRLALHGYPPMPSGPGPDLVRFLAAAPALASLSVDVARPLTAPQFAVWAAAHRRERVPPAFLGALRSLAVARPDPTDAVFAHLPRGLRGLALLAYPRPTRFVPTEDAVPAPPTCAGVLGMLSASALPQLRILRLALAAPFDRSFVDELARLFPLLEVLQLQELRMVSIAVDGREQAVSARSLRFGTCVDLCYPTDDARRRAYAASAPARACFAGPPVCAHTRRPTGSRVPAVHWRPMGLAVLQRRACDRRTRALPPARRFPRRLCVRGSLPHRVARR